MIYFKQPKLQKFADLHIHTTASDGEFSPKQILAKCKSKNIAAIAITDHDSIQGVIEAKANAADYGVDVYTGIEMSMAFNGSEQHLLGYFFNENDSQMNSYLVQLGEQRIQRAHEIVQKLNGHGFDLSFEDVMKQAHDGTIGRPHIAKAMVEAKIVRTYQSAFNRWIGDGKAACEPKKLPEPTDLISLIHACGGIAILAHPGGNFLRENFVALKRMGLDGIEVIHPRHTKRVQEELHQVAFETGLLSSGGSDFHTDKVKSNSFGKYKIELSQLEKLQQYARNKFYEQN